MTCTTDPRSGSPWDNGPFHRLPGFAGVKAKAEKRKDRAVTESVEVTRLEKAVGSEVWPAQDRQGPTGRRSRAHPALGLRAGDLAPRSRSV